MNNCSLFRLRKFYNIIYSFQLRCFRGKALTSYQKKLSRAEDKSFNFDIVKIEPIDIIVSQSIKDDKHHSDSIKTKSNVANDSNEYLKKVTEIFLSCDDEYRKMILYGSENENVTQSDFNCHGCGSNINCSSMYNPGYIPFEIYKEHCSDIHFMKNILCIRCFYLQQNLDPLDVSLDNDIYHDVLLKKLNQCDSATIILLTDMTDLPWSVPSDLSTLCLPHVRLIVIGNKLDLLPLKGNLKQAYIDQLVSSLKQRGIHDESISFVDLLSAIDCTGVDSLIDRILSYSFYKNEPIFLVGSTNSGKSTIFNRLLKSDLCKTIAKGNVGEALVSNWPGTTLNVLRFPMVNLTKELISRRGSAKIALSQGMINPAVDAKDHLLDSSQIIETKLQAQSGEHLITYSYYDDRIQSSTFDEHQMRLMYDECYKYEENKITTKKWCYDTPGFINPDQLINYLPKNDLDRLGDRSLITTPHTYILKAGFSIIMENLARVDIIEAEKQVYVCVHGILPVEIVATDDIEKYIQENDHIVQYSFKKDISGSLLAKIRSEMPLYDPNVHSIPDLMAEDMELETNGFDILSGDVVLSSIGWVGVSGVAGGLCKIRAWTPARIGCCMRTPSLTPFSIKRKGVRKGNCREFTVR